MVKVFHWPGKINSFRTNWTSYYFCFSASLNTILFLPFWVQICDAFWYCKRKIPKNNKCYLAQGLIQTIQQRLTKLFLMAYCLRKHRVEFVFNCTLLTNDFFFSSGNWSFRQSPYFGFCAEKLGKFSSLNPRCPTSSTNSDLHQALSLLPFCRKSLEL